MKSIKRTVPCSLSFLIVSVTVLTTSPIPAHANGSYLRFALSTFCSFSFAVSSTVFHKERLLEKRQFRDESNRDKDSIHWNMITDNATRAKLEDLQNRHPPSAILQFIELTRNTSFVSKDQRNNYCVRFSFDDVKFNVSETLYKQFDKQANSALRIANILTNLMMHRLHSYSVPMSSPLSEIKATTSHSNETILLNKAFFWSLIHVNLESDSKLFGSGIAFKKGQTFPIVLSPSESSNYRPSDNSNSELFAPYVFRNVEPQKIPVHGHQYNSLIFLDLGKLSADFPIQNKSKDEPQNYCESVEWYKIHEKKSLGSYYHTNPSKLIQISLKDGKWTSPYLDCGATNTWLISYSVPFFGPTNGNSPKTIDFRGVVVVSINLRDTDINQCSQREDNTFFAGTHKCRATTECQPIHGNGFRRGSYHCRCKPGYYVQRKVNDSTVYYNYFNGTSLEDAFVGSYTGAEESTFECTPCPQGCQSCVDSSPCFVQYNIILRSIALGLQSFCATITLVLNIVIFKLRRSKAIASSRWIMLEMILFGAFLLYITVIIRYFEPTPVTCFIEPWFREVGFGFCFGAIIIKLYRIYAEFQTRKAHRVCVRDKDLLKYLGGIILVVIGYMASWSALVLDSINGITNITGKRATTNILEEGRTSDGLRYMACKELSWDYVTESGELCFLITGIYITYCIRNARPEIYDEKWTLCVCIYIETIVSTITYVIRHIFWSRLHPDYIFALCLIRCQLTVSLVLLLLLGPKIWYHNRPPTSKNKSRYFSARQNRVPEVLKLHSAILSNGEVDIGEINLSDMDPEDIRSELRRVYTQMQILRNKTMRKDNPHISKRRGGRKGTHRRFSLQPFHHKHKSHAEQEVTEVSRTPEESTASFEGTSVVHPDGPSVVRIESDATNGENR